MATNDDAAAATATFTADVPRDRSAYHMTLPVAERIRYRRDPAVDDWILEEVIEEGECVSLEDEGPAAIDGDETQRFAFQHDAWTEGLHNWRVVVAIDARAYLEPDRKHEIVAAYCRCHVDEAPDCEVEDPVEKVVR